MLERGEKFILKNGGPPWRSVWLAPGLGSLLRAVIPLPTIRSLSVGPNTLGNGRPRLEHPFLLSSRPTLRRRSVGAVWTQLEGDVIMVGSMRWLGAALTGLSLITGIDVLGGNADNLPPEPTAGSSLVQEQLAPGVARPAETSGTKPDVASIFSQPGDDPPRPFVPLHPSTVDDRQQTEAMRLYATARGLEDRGSFSDAVVLLQQAAETRP